MLCRPRSGCFNSDTVFCSCRCLSKRKPFWLQLSLYCCAAFAWVSSSHQRFGLLIGPRPKLCRSWGLFSSLRSAWTVLVAYPLCLCVCRLCLQRSGLESRLQQRLLLLLMCFGQRTTTSNAIGTMCRRSLLRYRWLRKVCLALLSRFYCSFSRRAARWYGQCLSCAECAKRIQRFVFCSFLNSHWACVETFWISCAIYNLALVLVIVIPIVISNGGGREFLFYIRSTGIILLAVGPLIFIYVPKLAALNAPGILVSAFAFVYPAVCAE